LSTSLAPKSGYREKAGLGGQPAALRAGRKRTCRITTTPRQRQVKVKVKVDANGLVRQSRQRGAAPSTSCYLAASSISCAFYRRYPWD